MIRNRIVERGEKPASQFQANPKNWRQHPKVQRETLAAILGEVGWVQSVIENKRTGNLIDGHERIWQALQDNDAVVPYVAVDLSPEEEALILATFDPISAMAVTDKAMLEDVMRDIETTNATLTQMLANMAENEGIIPRDENTNDSEVDIDKAEEINKKWKVQYGDLWLIGEHRLLCGDSANANDVKRLMRGEKANIVITDPPYGVSIGDKNKFLNSFQPAGRNLHDIKDDNISPDDLKAKLLPAFLNIKNIVMADDCTVFITAPQGGELGMMMMMMKDAGLPVRHVLIWKKNSPTFSLGRLDYDYQHEPILLTWGKKHKRPMRGMHKTSVWEIDKPRSSENHPTMKPVELYVNALLNNSDPSDISFDAYCGSGTMLVASENEDRKARCIEIEPKFCAVALERMSNAFNGIEIKKDA